jgi:hypothetical protein
MARTTVRMKQLCLLLAALTVAAAATASEAWVRYGESEIGAHYFDPATVRADGARRRVWRLIDRRERLPAGIQSGKALIEIDCGNSTYRYIKTLQYSGKMGKGRYLGGEGEQPPEHMGPDTMAAHLARLVC